MACRSCGSSCGAIEVRPLPGAASVLHALLDAYQQWASGPRERPRIAILDWREVPTYSEFVALRRLLPARMGSSASSSIRARWSIATASCWPATSTSR